MHKRNEEGEFTKKNTASKHLESNISNEKSNSSQFNIASVKRGEKIENYYIQGVGIPASNHKGVLSSAKKEAEKNASKRTSFIQIRKNGELVATKRFHPKDGWGEWEHHNGEKTRVID